MGKEANMNIQNEAAEPFEFIVGLPEVWVQQLLRTGGDLNRRIESAVRAYLRRWKAKHPGVDLPSESLAGRLSNIPGGRQGHAIIDIVWKVPEDIRDELAWDDGALSHIRAAIHEDLGGHDKSRGTPAPAPRPPLTVGLPVELLKRLKALPGKLDAHFMKALQQYRSKWNRESISRIAAGLQSARRLLTPDESGGSYRSLLDGSRKG